MTDRKPKPDVMQMLLIGRDLGLDLEGAYTNYQRHYDCFFYMPEFQAQNNELTRQLREIGLVGDKLFNDIDIDDAIEMVTKWKTKS